MKYKTLIDPTREEEVVIYAHERRPEIAALEAYLEEMDTGLTGYGDEGQIVPLHPVNVHCFIVENGKVFALTDREKLQIRLPLYALEERLGLSFVRLNQSCLGNLKMIKRFDTSIGGALMVTFANSHRDYVSRRQLKIVKERIGFKS